MKEVAVAMVIALVIIFSILTVTTTSWFEPVLFIGVMGIAIIINMGSNIIFGTISFFTFATAAILQLAVSMDYSIFLLHTFTAYKQKGMEIHEAIEMALRESAGAIVASSMTTIVGFLAMALMKFSTTAPPSAWWPPGWAAPSCRRRHFMKATAPACAASR